MRVARKGQRAERVTVAVEEQEGLQKGQCRVKCLRKQNKAQQGTALPPLQLASTDLYLV